MACLVAFGEEDIEEGEEEDGEEGEEGEGFEACADEGV